MPTSRPGLIRRPLPCATRWTSTSSRRCAARVRYASSSPSPIDDDVLERLLDTARFAPSGGNRQGWRVIVVKDPATRAALRDLYLSGWYEYLAMPRRGWCPGLR